MKKFLIFTFLTTVTFGVLLNSCTKEPVDISGDSVPSSLIQTAKAWHYEQTHASGLASGRVSNEKKLILTPKFGQAKLKTLANGRKILYTPAMDFDLKNEKIAMLRGFVFEVRHDQIISGRIVEIYGSVDFIAHHKDDLLTKYVEKQLGDFSGQVITYDVNYKYIYGFVYENGKRIGAQSALGYKVMGDDKQVSSGRTLDGDCYEVYYVAYYSDGSETWTYLYSYCNSSGSGENPGGGTGSGGSSGDVSGNSFDFVYNQVAQPCISQQVDNALSTDAVNKISALVNQYFNVSDAYDIVFNQSTALPNTVDAQTLTTVDADGNVLVTITFNANTLPNAAQEYTLATVYHEVLHAILEHQGIPNSEEHEAMADDYIANLTFALQENFPNLSDADATNLAWFGLDGTAAYNNLSDAQRAAIIDTNTKYLTNQLGTGCN